MLDNNFEIVFINLDKDQDKNEAMSNFCNKLGLPWRRFAAYDGTGMRNSLPYNLIDINFKDPNSGRNQTFGELGCALSHLGIWSEIVASGKTTLILEDDVCSKLEKDELIAELERIVNILNTTDYELCYLGRQPMQIHRESGVEVFENLVEPRYSWLLHSYIVTPEAAKKLVDQRFVNALVPSDEWVPYMINKGCHSYLSRKYGDPDNPIKALAHADINLFWQSRIKPSNTEDCDEILVPGASPFDEMYAMCTVATDPNELGFQFLLSSSQRNGWEYSWNLADGDWEGGDVANGPGGGHKVNLLKKFFEETEDLHDETIVMFVDGYDVSVLDTPIGVIRRWVENFNDQKVLFAAEKTIWPYQEYSDWFPRTDHGYNFLNSGCFIGRVKNIKKLLDAEIEHDGDDQFYFQSVYANSDMIELDHQCMIFQCLADAVEDIEYEPNTGELLNTVTRTDPQIIHGNGPSKDIWLMMSQSIEDLYCPSQFRRYVA